jgi:hypothetical protein
MHAKQYCVQPGLIQTTYKTKTNTHTHTQNRKKGQKEARPDHVTASKVQQQKGERESEK